VIVVGVALTPHDAPVETKVCTSAIIILEFFELKAKDLINSCLLIFQKSVHEQPRSIRVCCKCIRFKTTNTNLINLIGKYSQLTRLTFYKYLFFEKINFGNTYSPPKLKFSSTEWI